MRRLRLQDDGEARTQGEIVTINNLPPCGTHAAAMISHVPDVFEGCRRLGPNPAGRTQLLSKRQSHLCRDSVFAKADSPWQACLKCGGRPQCSPRGDPLCVPCLVLNMQKVVRNSLARTRSAAPKVCRPPAQQQANTHTRRPT